jgi:hypothetical protein
MSRGPDGLPDSRTSTFQLIALIALAMLSPAALHLAPAGTGPPPSRLRYLPAVEGRRESPFHAHRIEELQRLEPGYVVIGDSMAGTRINEHLLGRLSGRPVAPLLQAGSGPAFWYLALKNWVVASGIRPRAVFIFFRDTNLTDTMFRLEQFGWSLDPVATDQVESELNTAVEAAMRGSWHQAHAAIDRAYGSGRLRRSADETVTRLPATWITASRRRQAQLLDDANRRFGLDHLRVMEAADIASDAGTDFDAVVEQSLLPLMIRDAARAGFELCFVRVQRRPRAGGPPNQSPRLREYIDDLRRYVEARGALFRDDTGDPAMTLDMYADGDHVASGARDRYTALFFARLSGLFGSVPPQQ